MLTQTSEISAVLTLPWLDSSTEPGEPAPMNSIRFLVVLVTALSILPSEAFALPHLDLDLSGAEYRQIQETRRLGRQTFELPAPQSASSGQLAPVLNAGKRNLDFLNHLNARRPGMVPLSLSSPDSQMGFPVDSPRVFNVAIVLDGFSKLRAQLPASLAAIVLDGASFSDSPGVSDEDYVKAALQVDRLYQLASRWLLLEPYLGQLAWRKKSDIRAYLSLSSDGDLPQKLSNFETLPGTDQQKLLKQLYELCFNDPALSDARCQSELSAARNAGMLRTFYSKHVPAASRLHSAFFAIPVSRSDVTWTSLDPSTMSIPFADPRNDQILNFLRDNIEDEWKWNGWRLKLDFRPTWTWGMTHIEFQPGATPHVDGIGGSTITMDANSPLTEYNVQWTIRHEFGHVLGFPDCYLEFWDGDQAAIVSYQLDVTNLMCSRRGRLQQKHFDELKRVYLK